MSTPDRFIVNLDCPKCHLQGKAHLSQEDGWAFVKGKTNISVDAMPDGFKAMVKQSRLGSLDIFCLTCDVSAIG